MHDDTVEKMLEADVHEIRRRDGGPMRDVLRLHPNMEVRMWPSWKTRRPVYTAGTLELAWRKVFEADPGVADYRSQPLTLCFGLNGAVISFTPDFEVLRNGRVTVVETKPASMLERKPKLQEVLARVQEIYSARGNRFVILGYDELPPDAWMVAAEDLADLGRTLVDPLDEDAVTTFLRERGTTTLARAATAVTRHPDPIRAVISLALRPRSVVLDMNGAITPATRVRLRRHVRG